MRKGVPSLVHALGALGVLGALALAPGPARAGEEEVPAPLQGVDVEERLGAQVPGDVSLVDQDGRGVRLADLLAGGKPVLVSLVYYECPLLCGMILSGQARAMKESGLELGRDYKAITVSFDPREKAAQAFVRQKHYLQSFDRTGAKEVWPFLVGTAQETRRLADAMGFHYAFDEASKQYAHPAAIMVLTPEGKVSRYLYGVEFPGKDLRLALVEAAGGRVGTSFDRFLLTCYRYDPVARKYVPYALGVVRAGALLVLIGLAGTLVVLWRREVKGAKR